MITNAGIVTLSLLLISDGIINLVVKHRGGGVLADRKIRSC